eukprot:TRINITY_DN7391_c0_g2_i1.p2 TRINITY_DN7391_c0_g2~~TRINITY_DN7391_c0_g2_i1.p2  ORF type:complete len:223 (+),score=53.93 TRINITY_DN7391_c0_g2_i1:75-743(+)
MNKTNKGSANSGNGGASTRQPLGVKSSKTGSKPTGPGGAVVKEAVRRLAKLVGLKTLSPAGAEGECLYEATAMCIHGREGKDAAGGLRAAAVAELDREDLSNLMLGSEEEKPAMWQEYKTAAARRGAWGDALMIAMMARVTGRTFLVYTERDGKLAVSTTRPAAVHADPSAGRICLGYAEGHFVCFEGDDEDEAGGDTVRPSKTIPRANAKPLEGRQPQEDN